MFIPTPEPKCEGVGGGGNSDDWRKSLALCLLCGADVWVCQTHHAYECVRFKSNVVSGDFYREEGNYKERQCVISCVISTGGK